MSTKLVVGSIMLGLGIVAVLLPSSVFEYKKGGTKRSRTGKRKSKRKK